MYLGLDINVGSSSSLFEGESLDTNSGNPVNIALPKLQRETNSASTPASKLLSDYTIAEVENNSNRIDENVLKTDFYNALDKVYQEEHHQNFEELSKQSLKNALEFQGRVYQDFTKEKVNLSEKQLVSTGRYEYPCIVTDCSFTHKYRAITDRHLFKYIKVSPHYCEQGFPNMFFARDQTDLDKHKRSVHVLDKVISKRGIKRTHQRVQNTIVKNNSNRIDENVLKTDFYNTLDKKCQEEHHQNFEELSKQSLKNALEFQGRFYQAFTKEKVNLSEKQLVSTDECEYPCIVTDCSFTHKDRATIKWHLFKHIKVSPYYCEQCLPDTFFTRDVANLNSHKKKIHSSDTAIIHKPVQNKIVENNSNRIDENVLKTDFYNTLDKKCQEEHHQNFEELSKQSLKNALEFQGRFYQAFTKEKVNLSEKQLVSTDKYQDHCNRIFSSSTPSNSKGSRKKANSPILRYEYPCIVTDCSFTDKYRASINRHLFKHIKVSPHYCEQCFPNMFFARDKTDLDKHKRSVHCLDKVISKRGIKRTHQCVQNTMNGSSGFTVNQESDQQKTDSASTPASKLLSDNTIAEVENNSNRIDESVLKVDFYNALDKICQNALDKIYQEEHHQSFEKL